MLDIVIYTLCAKIQIIILIIKQNDKSSLLGEDLHYLYWGRGLSGEDYAVFFGNAAKVDYSIAHTT
jgi:hypothetical protein